MAEARGHNPDIAEAFMNKEKEVKIGDEIVSPKGKLLTFDAKSASRVINGKPVLAAGIAANLSDLAAKAKLDGELRRVEMSGFERLGLAIAGLAPLFLLGGIVCAYLEFKLPGATIPGFLAAIFFGLFFFGHYVVGLAGFEVVALFILGVLLLVLEFMFFPGLVLPAVIGVALMVGSLLLAMADRYPSQPFIPSLDQLTMPLINLALAIAFAAVVISILVTMLPKTTLYSRFVLAETIHGGSGEPEPGAAPVAVGATGTTRTALRPAGKAELAGRMVDVVSEGGFVEPGTAVKVVKVEGATVVVSTVV